MAILTSSIQEVLKTAVPSAATAPCFLNPDHTSAYTTPTSFTDLPSPAQSYYSSLSANSTDTCAVPKPSSGLSSGAKGGIVGGVIAAAFVVLGFLLWFLKRRMSSSRSRHAVPVREEGAKPEAVGTSGMPYDVSDWKEGQGSDSWSDPSSPSSPGWGVASGAELGAGTITSEAGVLKGVDNQDKITPIIVEGARDLRDENSVLIPVTYMPFRLPNSPTPSRHLSRRPIGSPAPGELPGGRSVYPSEVDGSSSGDEVGSLGSDARFSTLSYELLGREVYDRPK